ncbi:MAG: phosphopantothenoylcysteine decarboxylase [Pirellula sp.]|jgi:phosphopantothenoylcysteine decarboxylase/phosphopantothenate--cysteine ligase|nr:phosphopantothenoylcysteine decarboxylase [Pirellula sp.]
MAHILITSGPTRQYLDPVRYLTNASSGRMGKALAEAALHLGHQVTVVSGPVEVVYPREARVIHVLTTLEMMDAATEIFANADGLIGAAAPCDYMPKKVEASKLSKTGNGLQLELIETPDIVATLGANKQPRQWVVGFALETDDVRFRAIVKMSKKCCDMIVSNRAEAMNAATNSVEIIYKDGRVLEQIDGPKSEVAHGILRWIEQCLINA